MKNKKFNIWKVRILLVFQDAGFPTGVENIEGGSSSKFDGGLRSIHGGIMGELKMLSKNTCHGVHLIVKLPAISLQACSFIKN